MINRNIIRGLFYQILINNTDLITFIIGISPTTSITDHVSDQLSDKKKENIYYPLITFEILSDLKDEELCKIQEIEFAIRFETLKISQNDNLLELVRNIFADYNLGIFSEASLFVALFGISFTTFKTEEYHSVQFSTEDKKRIYGEVRFRLKLYY